MSKLKAVRRVISGVDNVPTRALAPGQKADELLNPGKAPGNLGFIDDLDAYDRIQGEADRLLSVEEVDEAIKAEEFANFENNRQVYIQDGNAETDMRFQHRTPEEFVSRLGTQLASPRFRAQEVLQSVGKESDIETMAKTIEESAKVDEAFQTSIKEKLYADRRYASRVQEEVAGSAYGDRIFINVARQTDPTRSGTDFVQFEDAHELGLHSGTNAAAQQATIRSPEVGMQAMQAVDEMIFDTAMAAGMEAEQARRLLFDATADFFHKQFTVGRARADHEVWTEVADLLGARFEANGFPASEARQIIARLKQMPAASSTPHFFKGKNGLLLNDYQGNFRPLTVRDQLQRIFPEDYDELQAIGGPEATKKLQQFIESKGYDHVVYVNGAEDRGQLSIINWNPDLMVPTLDPRLVGDNTVSAANNAATLLLGSFGLGIASREPSE